jgi:DNA modification methylase
MEPTWQSECGRVQLYLGDCRDILPSIQCDAFVTDPPYGIGAAKMNLGCWRSSTLEKHDWDEECPDVTMLLSHPCIIFGGNYFNLPPTRGLLVWDKGPGFRGRDFAEAEIAWTSIDQNVRVFTYDPLAGGDYKRREHKTQKPVSVMKWCIGHVPDDCETICDPFMGSGTTGVACVQLNRRFIGIEKEPKYFEIAKRRIMEAMGKEVTVNGVRQRRMFA